MSWRRWPGVKGRIRLEASKSVASDVSPVDMGLNYGKVKVGVQANDHEDRIAQRLRAAPPAENKKADAFLHRPISPLVGFELRIRLRAR